MKKQSGTTLVGFIIGVVVGLAVALLVALYITKSPVPFMNKGQTRTPEQDAAEAERNKDWNPNGPLVTKNRPAPPPTEQSPMPVEAAPANPAASSGGPVSSKPATSTSKSKDPLGDLARTKAQEDGFNYFIQVGAYSRPEDAEAQRARLSLTGVQARVTRAEDPMGRQIYRVRVGPYNSKADADKAEGQIKATGQQTAQIRTQKTN